MKICVILLVFNRQEDFVKDIIERLHELAVNQVFVVNNGTAELVIESDYKTNIEIINTKKNLGSAGGFKTGILEAYRSENEYIWLLDDDNLPSKSSLDYLKENWNILALQHAENKLMLVSYRPTLMKHVYPFKSDGVVNIGLMKDSYLGFNINKMWRIIITRLTGKSNIARNLLKSGRSIPIGAGYYGGLFFSKKCISQEILPNEEFFIYWDDIDFTTRFCKSGGSIYMIMNSIVHELDDVQQSFTKDFSSYHPSLDLKPNYKAFHYTRNVRLLELRRGVESPLLFAMNKIVIVSVLFVIAFMKGNYSQFRLMLKSAKCAERIYTLE